MCKRNNITHNFTVKSFINYNSQFQREHFKVDSKICETSLIPEEKNTSEKKCYCVCFSREAQ